MQFTVTYKKDFHCMEIEEILFQRKDGQKRNTL